MDATDAGEAAEASILLQCGETNNIDTAADDIVTTVKTDIAHEVKEALLLPRVLCRCRQKQSSCQFRS